MRDIDFRIGSTRVTGTITTTRNAGRRNITVALAAPRIVLRDLGALPVVASAAANAATSGARSASEAHLIPDNALPLASLRDSDLAVDARIDEVVLAAGELAQAVELKAASSQGRLHLTRLHAAMLGGSMDASGVIDAAGATPNVDLRVAGRELDAGRLLAALGVPREMRGAKASLDITARSSGASLHAWAASANGEARVVIGPGTMPVAVSDRTSTLWQIASALNPSAARSDAIALRCAVFRLPLHDGIGIADRSLAVETDNLGLDGSGRVDLMHETLELRLQPILRQGSLIATELPGAVRISGAWRAPKVEIDRASTATAIAKLGALAATGGLPAVGAALLRPESSQDGPCAVALGTARAGVARSSAGAEAQTTAPSMTDLARGLSKLLPH